MCKLAGWTASKHQQLNKPSAARALAAVHGIIANRERDGFGFAQAGENSLRGRFVDPAEFHGLDAWPELADRAGDALAAFSAAWRAEQTGRYKETKPMMIHGRTATCGINLNNTHPFRLAGWTLAHNGVVSWHGKKCKKHKSATCDSQHILACLANGNTDQARKELLSDLSGYAAFLATSPDGRLIVARDNLASLFAGITNKGRWIFGTTAEIVEAIADAWKCKGVTAHSLDAWAWLDFPANGGEPTVSEWKHKGSTAKESRFSSRSIGREISGFRSTAWAHGSTDWAKSTPTSQAAEIHATSTDENPNQPTDSAFVRFPDWEPDAAGY